MLYLDEKGVTCIRTPGLCGHSYVKWTRISNILLQLRQNGLTKRRYWSREDYKWDSVKAILSEGMDQNLSLLLTGVLKCPSAHCVWCYWVSSGLTVGEVSLWPEGRRSNPSESRRTCTSLITSAECPHLDALWENPIGLQWSSWGQNPSWKQE